MVKAVARAALVVVMVGIGALHFVAPGPFVAIVPAALPAPLALVYVSGVFEILGGLGLLWERSRRFAAWGLIALYIAVFPANVNMAVNEIAPLGEPVPEWALWARLPFQLVFVVWAWWVGASRSDAERSVHHRDTESTEVSQR